MSCSPRRVVLALLAGALLGAPSVASAQDSTIPEDGAGMSSTSPVPLPDTRTPSTASSALPNTGTDPRLLFLTGMAMTLLGAGLRLRTADADDY